MNKPDICFFFDNMVIEYMEEYGKDGESFMIKDLKKYLASFSKNYEITMLTMQDASKIADWFLKNNLLQFVNTISNPA